MSAIRLSLVLLCLPCCTWCSRAADLAEILPLSALHGLSLQPDELPHGYTLITDTNVLGQLGMETNPDYVSRISEMESIAGIGGVASFLALYGHTNDVRLMLNGIYFKRRDRMSAFAVVQKTKPRLVTACLAEMTHGMWLLLVACDPKLTYSDAERQQMYYGIERYGKRLDLKIVFNQMEAPPEP
jgi:hypothetical protein